MPLLGMDNEFHPSGPGVSYIKPQVHLDGNEGALKSGLGDGVVRFSIMPHIEMNDATSFDGSEKISRQRYETILPHV